MILMTAGTGNRTWMSCLKLFSIVRYYALWLTFLIH